MALQFWFAVIIRRTSFGSSVFEWLADRVVEFLSYTDKGSEFVFGRSYRDHFFVFQVFCSMSVCECGLQVVFKMFLSRIFFNYNYLGIYVLFLNVCFSDWHSAVEIIYWRENGLKGLWSLLSLSGDADYHFLQLCNRDAVPPGCHPDICRQIREPDELLSGHEPHRVRQHRQQLVSLHGLTILLSPSTSYVLWIINKYD